MLKSSRDPQLKPDSPRRDRIRHVRLQDSFDSLLQALIHEFKSIPQERLKFLIHLGSVYVDGIRSPEGQLGKGSVMRVHLEPRRFTLPDNDDGLVVHVDEDYLIANKPAGLPTHATLDNAVENLLSFLSQKYGTLFPAQRLDHGTSGLLTLARSPKAHRQFQIWQKNGLIQKFYRAVSSVAAPIGPLCHTINEKECRLNVLNCEMSEPDSFQLEIELITGRTHQIRAQLALVGAPLIGDSLYGGRHHATIHLHSERLILPDLRGQRRQYQVRHSFVL